MFALSRARSQGVGENEPIVGTGRENAPIVLVRVSTVLDASPEAAWRAVKRPETLAHVTRGLLGFRPKGGMPEDWGAGTVVRARLFFFGVLPAWTHEIRVVRVDDAAREIYTNERGGPVRGWNHRITIGPAGPSRALYTDEIEVRAGPLTPLVWLYAQLFYRYRQARWRRLARRLPPQAAPGST
jgi:ligand-binding SRPBCC domain-containing protein